MAIHRTILSLAAVMAVGVTQPWSWGEGEGGQPPSASEDSNVERDSPTDAAPRDEAGAETVQEAVPHAPPPTAPPRSIWIRAVGDIQLDRGVERGYTKADLLTLFAGARHFLRAPDITFGNLESIAAHTGAYQGRAIAFRAHPNTLMPLADAGFDVLSLANNHAYDYGRSALKEAARRLEGQGITPLGVRFGAEARPRHRVIERNGIRVAFLAYSAFAFNDAPVTSAEHARLMQREIAAARTAGDRVVVSFHWGVEYQVHANAKQRRLGRAAIDAGADLVIGHHPHVFQGVEIYRERIIAYSLGNFLFDQPWAHTRKGLLLDWRVDELGEQQVRLYPVKIDKKPYRSRILIGEAAREQLKPMIELCATLGTTVELEEDALRIVMHPPGAPLAEASQCVEPTAVSRTPPPGLP